MKFGSNPERDWDRPVYPSRTRRPGDRSVRTPKSGVSFVGPAIAVMSIPMMAVLALAAYFGYHVVA